VSESQKPVLAKTQAIRGMRDLLPSETELWQFVERTAQETFGTFGYGEIRLPVFERMSLFERAVGAETDIVSKEMFNWIDDPEISTALRNLRTVMQDTKSIPSVDGSPARLKLEALARAGAFNNLNERVRIALRPEATNGRPDPHRSRPSPGTDSRPKSSPWRSGGTCGSASHTGTLRSSWPSAGSRSTT